MGGSRRMRAFTEPLQELEEFQKIQQALKKQSIQVTGCIDAQKAHSRGGKKETDRHIQ